MWYSECGAGGGASSSVVVRRSVGVGRIQSANQLISQMNCRKNTDSYISFVSSEQYNTVH